MLKFLRPKRSAKRHASSGGPGPDSALAHRYGDWALFEHSPDAVFLTRPDGTVEAANAAAQAMLGMSEAEIVERGRDGVLDATDPKLKRMLAERDRTGRTRGVLHLRRADGSTFPAEVTSARFEDAEGRPRSFVVAQDISERARFEAELAASEQRYRSVFEHSKDGLLLLTSEGDVLAANPAALDIFGMSLAELKARGRDGITDGADPEFRRMVEQRRREGRSHGHIRMFRGNGERFTGEVSAVQFRSGAGEDLVSVIVRDTTEQRQRERQLAASETRMRAVFDYSMDAVLLSAPDEGRLLQCNPAAERLFGLSEAELKRRHRDQVFDTDNPESAEFIRQRDATGHARGVLNVIRADGTKVPVEATTSVFYDEAGNRRSSVILRDISETLHRERELRESEDRYRALFESSTDAILISNPQGAIFEANHAAERLFGMSSEELGRLGRKGILDPDDPAFRKLLADRIKYGRARAEIHMHRADGSRFLAEVNTVGFKDLEGNDRTSVVIRDITESKNQQLALQQSEDRLRATVEAALDPIVGMDAEGRIVQFNEAAERCFGHRRETLLGKPLAEHLIPQRFRDKHTRGLKRYLDTGQSRVIGRRVEVTGLRADGEEFPAELAISPTETPEGLVFVAYLRDVTESRRREESLRASEERFRAFFEHSPDAILIGEPETGTNLDANPAAERLFGLPRERIIGLDREQDMDIAPELLQELLQERARKGWARFTCAIVVGDGQRIPVEMSSALYTDKEGNQRAINQVRDIRDQVERERRLRESEERFRIVADNTGQAIYEIDLESGAMTWAGACEHMFGLDADGLERLSAAERLAYVPAQDRDRMAEQYRKAADAGGGYHFEYRLDTVDGRHIEVEDSGVVIAAARRMYGVIRDVTERNRLIHRLEEQKSLLSALSETQQAILDALPAHVALLGADGEIRFVNASWRRFAEDNQYMGRDAGLGSNYLSVCEQAAERGSGFAGAVVKAIRRVIAGEQMLFDGEYDCHAPTEERWFRQVITPYRSGGERGAVVAHLEVTERVQAERQLELVAAAFRGADEALVICDRRFFIRDVNHAYERLIGQQRNEALGGRPAFLDIGGQGKTVMQGLQRDGHWRGELLQRSVDGRVFTSRASITEIEGSEQGDRFLVINFQDISQLREIERRVDYLSYHDALTGLPNRLALEQWFGQFIIGAPDECLALAYIDLDRFKAVNESFGHSIGDEVLVETAQRLRRAAGRHDYVARLGGDDFIVVLSGIERRGQAAFRVREMLASVGERFVHAGRSFFASATAGVSLYPEDGRALEDLLRRADAAHSSAKGTGRGQLQFFSPAMHEEVEQQALVESHLRDAISNGELTLQYQPSVRLPDGHIVGLEALARWESAELGMVSPVSFIAVAESTGLIVELGRWIFDAACAQVREWRDRGLEFGRLAINLSPMQFQHSELLDQIREAVDRHGLTGDSLRVEITENVLVIDPEHTIEVLNALREMGIEIAVDDFGTGYSSLAYLRSFPIQHIKLDRTFIKELPASRTDASIVSSVIGLAHQLGMNVIAEGIETAAQREFLSEAGCDQAQGHLFSRPLKAKDVPWLLANHRILPVARTREGTPAVQDPGANE